MKRQYKTDDEIDLIEIIRKLWKEKVLIIGFSLFFAVIAYGIGLAIPKKYQTNVRLSPPLILEFKKFQNVFDIVGKTNEEFQNLTKYGDLFYLYFKNEVFSISNFAEFLRSEDNTKAFLQTLKEKEITVEQYLQDNHFEEKVVNLRLKQNETLVPELIFTYTQELNGPEIVNKYITEEAKLAKSNIFTTIENNLRQDLKDNQERKVIYLQDRKRNLDTEISQLELQLKEYVPQQTRSLENKLFEYQHAVKTAKSINLEESIPTSIVRGNSGSMLNEPGALFYKGAKVLESEIENIRKDLANLDKTEKYNTLISNLEKAKNQLSNLDQTKEYNQIIKRELDLNKSIKILNQLDFQWDPILQKATQPKKHISPKKSIYVLVGLMMGFFLSLIIIFSRSMNRY